jgi:hypothetical protein
MTKTKVLIIAFAIMGTALLIDSLYRQSLLSRSVYKAAAEPLFLFALPLILISIILMFVREEVFRAWLHFAYWWIPTSLVLIYFAGGWSGGGFGMPNVLDQEFVSMILSALFLIISLLLIIWKYFTTRRT